MRGKCGAAFSRSMDEEQKRETKEIHSTNLKNALELVSKGICDMLVLDEALDVYQLDLIDQGLFIDMIKNKPMQLELVLTGHKPIDWVMDQADYITEMVKVRHPYNSGIKARKGIEF